MGGAYYLILAIRTLAAFQLVAMNAGNDGLNVRSIAMNIGSNGTLVCCVSMRVRDGYTRVYPKFGL